MHFLTAIPSELLLDILSEWTAIEKLPWIDIACCSRCIRPHLLEILSMLRTKQLCGGYSLDNIIFDWVFLRGITVTEVMLTDDSIAGEGGGKLAFPLNFDAIEGLMLRMEDKHDSLVDLLPRCTSIKSLFCDDKNLTMFLPLQLRRLTELQLNFRYNSQRKPQSMSAIVEHCCNLVTLELPGGRQFEDECFSILRRNPSLRSLKISSLSNDILHVVMDHCPLMEIFSCRIDSIEVSDAIAFLRKFPKTAQLFLMSMDAMDQINYSGSGAGAWNGLSMTGLPRCSEADLLTLLGCIAPITYLNLSFVHASTQPVLKCITTTFRSSLKDLHLACSPLRAAPALDFTILHDFDHLTSLTLEGFEPSIVMVYFDSRPNRLEVFRFIYSGIPLDVFPAILASSQHWSSLELDGVEYFGEAKPKKALMREYRTCAGKSARFSIIYKVADDSWNKSIFFNGEAFE